MAVRTYQSIGYVGTNMTYAAAESIDTIPANSRGFLHVKNASGSPTTVTVVVPGMTQGVAHPDVAKVVSAGTENMIGPFVPALFDPASSAVVLTFSATASVTVAYITL